MKKQQKETIEQRIAKIDQLPNDRIMFYKDNPEIQFLLIEKKLQNSIKILEDVIIR